MEDGNDTSTTTDKKVDNGVEDILKAESDKRVNPSGSHKNSKCKFYFNFT